MGFAYLHYKQPKQHLINCYNYINATREATVELEKKQEDFNQLPFAQKKEFRSLRDHLHNNRKTLYHLENELRDRIDKGSF